MRTIPVLDLKADIRRHKQEYLSALETVLDSGHFILGPNVEAFEKEVATFLGVKFAIGVNSGTDALVISLRAAGVGPGDEVITSPFSFFATAEAISVIGARPVFVDIDPSSYNIDPSQIEAKVTPQTRAIVPVHLYGNPCVMAPILQIAARHGLKVIEDCAQSMGAMIDRKPCGSLGDFGAFSFFPSKTLGGFGDGGMIATNDKELAALCRKLRAHGSEIKYRNEILGYNSRLDELQAAVLRVKLRHLNQCNEARRVVAQRYQNLLGATEGVTLPSVTSGGTHVFHQFTVRVHRFRDGLQQGMKRRGVDTMIYYPKPIHQLPVYSADCHPSFREAERAAQEVLSLPIWPDMEKGDQEYVALVFKEELAKLSVELRRAV